MTASLTALAMLYGRGPAELVEELRTGATRTSEMLDRVKIFEPGAADRAERLAHQLEGLARSASQLAASIRARDEEPPKRRACA